MAHVTVARLLAQQSTGKLCRGCGDWKALAFFPRDRSRPDGRWHTCRLCNRKRWQATGKHDAAMKKERERTERVTRTGLKGLRQYPHPGDRFTSLPFDLRPNAQRLLNRYLKRHRHHMTPALYASLHATAASNARRVGNRSWARRMRRLKGYRRAERRMLPQ